jgi:hypothetical protein
MFEAVEFTEVRGREDPNQRILGVYPDEVSAVAAARDAKALFVESGVEDFAWWVVRQPGAPWPNSSLTRGARRSSSSI